ncbi:MAG: hypothetical protein NZ555_11420 [Geminicoccaceae bacterium]|nr:hypothetical protein [Geminicoccaceae bacterium]
MPLTVGEVYAPPQAGMVDIAENGVDVQRADEHHEVAPVYSPTAQERRPRPGRGPPPPPRVAGFETIEALRMGRCGLAILGLSLAVACAIVTRTLERPWLPRQGVTSAFFLLRCLARSGGLARARGRHPPPRRSRALDGDRIARGRTRHAVETSSRLVLLAYGCVLASLGAEPFRQGSGGFRTPSSTRSPRGTSRCA